MLRSITVGILGFILGTGIMRIVDARAIVQAQQNERQANGLEDECKQVLDNWTHQQ